MLSEIEQAINWINELSDVDITLLHCVLNYPTPIKNANIRVIKSLQKLKGVHSFGYSDHTKPPFSDLAIISAVSIGADTIEKHFTYDKTLLGNDHYHAYDASDATNIARNLNILEELLGSRQPDIQSQEAARINARRSLTLSRDLPVGHIISTNDLVSKRPLANGICASKFNDMIGKTITVSGKKDEPLTYNCVDNA